MIKAWGCLFGALFAFSAGARAPVPHHTAAPVSKSGAASGAASQATQAQQADRDFLAARDAFKAGDAFKLERLATTLDAHVLAPYVRYWQVKLKLDDAGPD